MMTDEQVEAERAAALRRATLHLTDTMIDPEMRVYWALTTLEVTETLIDFHRNGVLG